MLILYRCLQLILINKIIETYIEKLRQFGLTPLTIKRKMLRPELSGPA